MTNQELETSLPKKWEAIIGNDGQISDVLRGEYLPSVSSFHEYEPAIWLQNMVVDDAATPNFLFLGKKGSAVKEFLPFLSKTYLHHLGIDLKNGKLSRKTDKMGILCNKFRNRVIGSKRSSRKGSDDYGTPTTYDVLMNDLIKSVIEVNESLYLDEFSKETDFEQKYNIFLQNQLHQNTLFLQRIKHKFEKATKVQQEDIQKACAGIQLELQKVASDMGDEEKRECILIFLDP
jgi:hypothetical protein